MVTAPVTSILPLSVVDAVVRKKGKTILNNINLDLAATGFTVMMGPNGSGKTTLLRLMHGLERLRTGSVSWNVDETLARTQQAFVFQTPVIMRRSVLDNIAYPLTLRGRNKSEARAKAADWADHVGLAPRREINAQFLSGGERQKLAIARALMCEPQVLFLDEPTTNLDGRSTREIEAILLAAHQNGTRIVMTTHDIGQARRLASDVIFLNDGRLCETTPAKRFFKQPSSEPAQAYLRGDIVE